MNAKLSGPVLLAIVLLPFAAGAQEVGHRAGRVACLGDSITVGYGQQVETASGRRCAVYAEVGRPTREMIGVLRRSVLHSGFDTVVVLGGTNDVVRPGGAGDARRNLEAIYRAARASGLRVIAVTVPPMGGSHPQGGAGAGEIRAAIDLLNDWIRLKADVDAVVDAHDVLADPARPDCLDPRLARHDRIHPNAAGQLLLAAAVAKTVNPPQPTLVASR